MSIQKRIQQGFLRMPTSKQAILLASIGMILAPLFPWFEFQKKAGAVTVWLGYEGPFFLTAILGSLTGAYLFYKLFTPLLGEAFFRGGEKCGPQAMIAGSVQLVLLCFAMSTYFHPLFLESSLVKSPGSGIFISGFASLIFLAAGWAAYRREKEGLDQSWMDFEVQESQEAPQKAWQSLEDSYQEPSPYRYPETPFQNHTHIKEEMPLEKPMPVFSHMNEAKPHQFRTESRFHQKVESSNNLDSFDGVNPLTLDPKTRYKLMKQKERAEQTSTNYWG